MLFISSCVGIEVLTFYFPAWYLHADMPKDTKGFGIKRNMCGYNVSDQSRAQE